MIFHKEGQAHRGGAADAGAAVHQCAALAQLHPVDVIGDSIEEIAYARSGGVGHRYLQVLNALDKRVNFHWDIDNCGDVISG